MQWFACRATGRPGCLPGLPPLLQTVGLLPTHCPQAMDSAAIQAAYAQSAFAYIDVRKLLYSGFLERVGLAVVARGSHIASPASPLPIPAGAASVACPCRAWSTSTFGS